MNLEQLRGFVEVAETGHFTRAAERLHVAQPTLSRQISTLEADLAVVLISRVRGNIALTEAGERLLPIARRMLADADTARTEMAELAGLRRGRIRIGATPTLCASLVAEVIGEFHRSHPGIDIHLLESGSRTLIAALMEGTLDLALVVTSAASGPARAVLEFEPILSERLVVVSASDRPDPFTPSPIATEDLAGVPCIAFPENYDLRVATDAAFRERGVVPSIALEGAQMDAALRFVAQGIGVAIVPAMIAALHPGLRTAPLADPAFARTISIARRSDMAPAHANAALQALVHAVADRLTAPSSATAALVTRVR